MAATVNGRGDAGVATAPRIDFALFDARCKERGADDEESRAALAGVDRVTLWRWRKGRTQPNGANLAHISHALDISLDELLGRKAA